LAAAREALSQTEGTPAEVYSRIVGYYRSVRNWNKGKLEEYGERKLFRIEAAQGLPDGSAPAAPALSAAAPQAAVQLTAAMPGPAGSTGPEAEELCPGPSNSARLILFVRPACPACPSAKAVAQEAAGRLGIPVDLVNADTADGMAEAVRRQVCATPTAILVSPDGREIRRAHDSASIAAFAEKLAG
jgi:ribonucleoside-triphosphate reductase